MDFMVIVIGLVAAAGGTLAVIEWRRKRNFLEHDFNLNDTDQIESDSELMRTRDEIVTRSSYGVNSDR